ANKFRRVTTLGVFTESPIPTPDSGSAWIAAGPDRNLWFTETSGNKIGRVTTSGVFAEFHMPKPTHQPLRIAAGPEGNVWFTDIKANRIAVIRLSTGLPPGAGGP